MEADQKVSPKRLSLFILAVVLLLSGGAAFYVGSHNFAIRSIGILAVIASVYLVRISNVHGRSGLPVAGGQAVALKATNGPGRVAWGVAIGLLLVLGVSLFYLYDDALHGYQEVLPVYMFAAAGFACAIGWGYLFARMIR